MSFLRFGGAEEDDRAEDLVRSSASSSSNDEDEDLQVQEQEGPPHIPARRVQLDRNSAPEFVFPLLPGDVPPGHEPSQELVYPPAWDAQQPGPSNGTSQPVTPARQPLYSSNTSPHQTNIAPYLQQSPSLAKNLEPVTRFLVEKAGRPLNEFEAAGIVDYIQKNVQVDKPEPFRFSTSPPRGPSPNLEFGTPNGASTPKKTLSRNPNGILRWQGAGSARPRNRYRSPGFGSRPQGPRIELSPIRIPSATDAKRRRVGNEAESSTVQKSAPPAMTSTIAFPTSNSTSPTRSTPAINGKIPVPPAPALAPAAVVTPKMNGATSPHLRTTGLSVKPTTPAVPSPLRQTWKQNDSPPQPPTRPTRAANYMTGLIKEVTPLKKPDVANPYQTASPVKMPSRKHPLKRLRPPAEKKEKQQKEPEMTAQAIIEATVPKGSKRARPPPDMERQEKLAREAQDTHVPPMTNGHSKTAKPMFTAEEVSDEDESPTKKRKTAKSTPVMLSVEEVVEDVEMVQDKSSVFTRPAEIIEPVGNAPSLLTTPSATPFSSSHTPAPASPMKTAFGAKTSAPREPSKLRYSYYADKEIASAEEKPMSEAPSALSMASRNLPKETQTTSPKAKLPPKEAVSAMEVDELPRYSFKLAEAAYPAGPSHIKARIAAASMSRLSLPTFEFKPVAPSTNGFNWTAAGMKAPAAATSGIWSCGTCMLENPDSAKDKCTICDAPRSGGAAQPAAVPQKTFDWSKTAIKVPPTQHAEIWQCDTCMLPNPDSAKLKCTVCEAARPGASSAPTGFDWSAAGLKAPGSSTDTWTCSLCMLKVPTSATKCTVCDTARNTMD
ncbi:hypothetical protein BDR05DRAFT_962398 [Suillus weaverae]|nr:hypothetical protein BDR05DRAFT_962398 [Suillus weaverae]